MKYTVLLTLLLACSMPPGSPERPPDAAIDSTLPDLSSDIKITSKSPTDMCNDMVIWIAHVAGRCIDDLMKFWRYMEIVEESYRCRSAVSIRDVRELYEECRPAVLNQTCEELGVMPEPCQVQIQITMPVEYIDAQIHSHN